MENQANKKTYKRRFGDRKDGRLLRKIDPMHFVMPVMMPGRTNNEAFISKRIDLTKTMAYIAKKNREQETLRTAKSAPAGALTEYPYNLFQIIVTAVIKTITLRPKMNRFISNKNLYMRNEVTASFVIKKKFQDESEEGLAVIHGTDDGNLESIRADMYRQITDVKGDKGDASSDSMDWFNRIPRFLSKAILGFIRYLNRIGKVPAFLIETDPYYTSCLMSNLGSIGLTSGYHHLADWGTNSLFIVIGEHKPRPFYSATGEVQMIDCVDLGITVDERLADGYYYSGSVRLLQKLIENPELLERPIAERIDSEGQ